MITLKEIIQGFPGWENTWAIHYLSEFLGKSIVTNDGGVEISGITTMSTAMSPVWQAITVLLMLAVFGTGLVKTAAEKKFLGNWDSFKTPAQMGLCILLLTPMANGITFGQMVYIKTIVIGSKAADLMWKNVYQEVQMGNLVLEYSGGSADLKQIVAERFPQTVPSLICAESLKLRGHASSPSFHQWLHVACGIPEALVPYWIGNPFGPVHEMYTKAPYANADIKSALSTAMDSTTGDIEAAQRNMEVFCYAEAMRKLITLESQPGNGNNAPMVIPDNGGAGIRFNESAFRAQAPTVIGSAATCVMGNIVAKSPSFEHDKGIFGSEHDPNTGWRLGWASAASMGNLIEDGDEKYAAKFNQVALPTVNLDDLPSGDSLLKAQIVNALPHLDQLTRRMDLPSVDHPGTIPGDAIAATFGAGALGALGGWASIAGYDPAKKYDPGQLSQAAKSGFQKKFGQAIEYIKTTSRIGKGMTRMIESMKSPVKRVVGKGLSWVASGAGTLMEMTGVGAVGGAILKGGSTLMDILMKMAEKSGPMFVIFGAIFFLLSSYELIPQAFMAVAVFMWMIRVVLWFVAIPMATAVIAIPGTKVGHDIWKDMLALTLTPLLIIFFYIIGLYAVGNLIAFTWDAMFMPYCDVKGTTGTCDSYRILDLLGSLLLGDLFVRFFIFFGMIVSGMMMAGAFLLKGPDIIFRVMGLRTIGQDTESFGQDLTHTMSSTRSRFGV